MPPVEPCEIFAQPGRLRSLIEPAAEAEERGREKTALQKMKNRPGGSNRKSFCISS